MNTEHPEGVGYPWDPAPGHPEGLIKGSGQLGEPRLFDPPHDPRHPEHCWCRWIYAGNSERWCPCCRDADTEDQPEDITP